MRSVYLEMQGLTGDRAEGERVRLEYGEFYRIHVYFKAVDKL